MRQQISRLAVGLFLALFASQCMAAGSHKYQEYRKYLQTTEYTEVALAMDANGLWAFYPAMGVMMAKYEALYVCKKHSKRPETCKVVDVSGLSAWWRGGAKGNPASSSYASALTPKGPTQSVVSASSNTAFHESECKEVWQQYGSGDAISKSYNATTTQQWDIRCWDYISKDGKTWIGSNKSSTSTASLTIRSNVRGDRVYIDGVYKGSTRLDLDLPKGRHTIRIEKKGYKTYEEEIDLKNALTLRASLEKIAEKPVQTADKSSLELEFWQTIKESDDPDMYKEYLRQFPEGVFAGLAKLKIKKLGGTLQK